MKSILAVIASSSGYCWNHGDEVKAEDIKSSEIFHTSFTVMRKDRNYQALGLGRGRGILLAVRLNLRAKRVTIPGIEDTDCDYVCVQVSWEKYQNKVYVAIFYFPPKTFDEVYTHTFDVLSLYLWPSR